MLPGAVFFLVRLGIACGSDYLQLPNLICLFFMKNPWKTLSGRLIYQNPWIELTEYQVVNPAGKPGIYGKVHFRNLAVGALPYEDGHVWMVGQYRSPLDRYSWEIPEGGCPEGEDPLNAARRELREETGLQAERYTPLVELHLSNSVSDEWAIIYLAQGLTSGPAQPEDTEELQVKRMPLAAVLADIDAGRITDAMTVAAILKLRILELEGKVG